MSGLLMELEPPIARVVLNRPERRNAVTQAMWIELARLCTIIATLPDIQVVIVEGSGGHFCSGADISEFDIVFGDRANARAYLAAIEIALNALARLDRPTIAKVTGSCMGGGLAIALACDLRFCAEDSVYCIPPAKLGLLYGVAETRLLIETVSVATAKDLLFSGRKFDASEALALGLVNRMFPETELASAVQEQANLWTLLSSASIRGAKKAIVAAMAGRESEVRGLVENIAMGPHFREGRAAFYAKRTPDFTHKA